MEAGSAYILVGHLKAILFFFSSAMTLDVDDVVILVVVGLGRKRAFTSGMMPF